MDKLIEAQTPSPPTVKELTFLSFIELLARSLSNLNQHCIFSVDGVKGCADKGYISLL